MLDHDPEILAAFAEESAVRISSLEQGLLALERDPARASADLLNSVFRDAHSVKAGANLLGLRQVEIAAHRLENVLARAEWDDPAIFEGLLCDDGGAVIGGVMSNLLVARGGDVYTPDLSQSGVAGVARARLLRAAARLGIRTHIDRLPQAAILAADEVMICNSVIGVRRVARLDTKAWLSAGWTDTLKTALDEDAD